MISIKVTFERFRDISFYEVLNGVGVYVIWDSQARAKPSYIGQGKIVSRVVKHADDFAFPIEGYIAIIGYEKSVKTKKKALVVEALLLEVARDTDRDSPHNKASGHMSRVQELAAQYNLVKVTFDGYNPFSPPSTAQPMVAPKHIWYEDGVEEPLSHDWNLRKRLTT